MNLTVKKLKRLFKLYPLVFVNDTQVSRYFFDDALKFMVIYRNNFADLEISYNEIDTGTIGTKVLLNKPKYYLALRFYDEIEPELVFKSKKYAKK